MSFYSNSSKTLKFECRTEPYSNRVWFDKIELKILRKYGFRELMFNSVRFDSAKEARKVLEFHCITNKTLEMPD